MKAIAASPRNLVTAIWGDATPQAKGTYQIVREAVLDKNWIWQNDYRMLNGVHAYGQRWQPYGNFNYPEEIAKCAKWARRGTNGFGKHSSPPPLPHLRMIRRRCD